MLTATTTQAGGGVIKNPLMFSQKDHANREVNLNVISGLLYFLWQNLLQFCLPKMLTVTAKSKGANRCFVTPNVLKTLTFIKPGYNLTKGITGIRDFNF